MSLIQCLNLNHVRIEIHEIHSAVLDPEGRFIISGVEIKDVIRLILLITIYAYYTDGLIFFTDIFTTLENSDIENKIITGDWNIHCNIESIVIYLRVHKA